MQQLIITGRIGKDAESRQAGGSNVVSFSVAVDQGFGDKKTSNWFRCNVWGKRGESLQRYLTKGSNVTVCGELTIGEYNGKPQFDLNASDVALQGGNQSSGGSGGGQRQERPQTRSKAQDDELDSDVPF